MTTPGSIKRIRRLLTLLLPGGEAGAAASELSELFEIRKQRDGRRAHLWLWRQVLHYPFRLLFERIRPVWPDPADVASPHTQAREPMKNLWIDLRHSVRSLLRTPLLTATIIATVGLGIGATTVLFGVVHSVLIEPLPYRDADRLLLVYWNRAPFQSPMSVADFQGLREHQTSFEQVEGYTFATVTYNRGEVAERIFGRRVTAGYFSLLGIRPAVGRDFDADAGSPSTDPAVIVSHGFWSRNLGARPGTIGEALRLDGVEHRLVGVLPPDPGPLQFNGDFFIATDWPEPPRRGPFFIRPIGRLREGVSSQAAAAEVQAINERLFPIWSSTYQDSTTEWAVLDLKDYIVGGSETRLVLSLSAVALVLVIACANAAGLLVAKAARRRRELGVRAALGASRGRLLQHLMTESALLAAAAVAAGLALTVAGLRLVRTFATSYVPRAQEISLDGATITVLLATTAASALLFGLLPALLGSRSRLDRDLPGTRSSSAGVAARRLRQALVVTQVAVATPLLVAAALLMVSLERLQGVDIGADGSHVLTGGILLPERSYPERADVLEFWERARRELEAVPGIEVVAFSDGRPPSEVAMDNNFFLEDDPTPPGQADPAVPWVAATQEYFEALGIPLLKGRLLDERDGGEGADSFVVDRAWEQRFFPDSSALGRRFRQGGCETCPFGTIVGVVGTVKYRGLAQPDQGTVYWAMAERPTNHSLDQITQRFRYLVLRTAVEPTSVVPQVRAVLRNLDPTLPLAAVATIRELSDEALEQPRYLSVLVGAFSLVALLLSVVGIYGIMAYFVQQHSRDIGIRLALGDRPAGVLGMVVGRGMRVVLLGLAAGLLAALGLTRFMSSLLFEVDAVDPTAVGMVAILIAGSALLACLGPARRAARLDPAEMLRQE